MSLNTVQNYHNFFQKQLIFEPPTKVGYSVMKRAYPFMARLIMNGGRCGGAVIADRYAGLASEKHMAKTQPNISLT